MKFEDGIFGIIFNIDVKRHEGERRSKKSVRLHMKIYGGNLKVHEICVRD